MDRLIYLVVYLCVCTACQKESSTDVTSDRDSGALVDMEAPIDTGVRDQAAPDTDMSPDTQLDSGMIDMNSDITMPDMMVSPTVASRVGDEIQTLYLRNCETGEDVNIVERAQDLGGLTLILNAMWVPDAYIDQIFSQFQGVDRQIFDYIVVVNEDENGQEPTLEGCRDYATRLEFNSANQFYLAGNFFEALWTYPMNDSIRIPWRAILKGGTPTIYCHGDGSGTDLGMIINSILNGEEPTCAPPPPPPVLDQPCGGALSCLLDCMGQLNPGLTPDDTISQVEEDNEQLRECVALCHPDIDLEARDLLRSWKTCVDAATQSGDQSCIMDRASCLACEDQKQACLVDEPPPSCSVHADCQDLTTYCSPNGICEPAPCIDEYMPVCGVEPELGSATYNNSCFMLTRSATALSDGECQYCSGQSDCVTDQYCLTVDALIESAVCISCTAETGPDLSLGGIEERVDCNNEPVCGADNQTYLGACQAACEGNVVVISEGECP